MQFDYESDAGGGGVRSYYHARVRLVQSIRHVNVAPVAYWLDVHVLVANVVDEPFVCSEPVYYVSVDENEAKNKKLFHIPIFDYDIRLSTGKQMNNNKKF